MLKKFYSTFIKPVSTDPDQRSREVVLNWLIAGMGCLFAIFFLTSIFGFILYGRAYTLYSLFIIIILLTATVLYGYKFRKDERIRKIASNLVLLLLLVSATTIVLQWGVTNIYGILFFSLTIITAGILLGSKYALYVAGVIALLLAAFKYAHINNIVQPDMSWVTESTSIVEVVNLITIFFIIALISWLFNKQMEQALKRAQLSEEALKKERDLLEVKVEERTRALQEAQFEKMQQIYKFAELGHLSTALFHDLAGSLSSLSLDIESLRKKGSGDLTKRIDSNIQYIDDVVQRVKSQIQGRETIETFDIVSTLQEIKNILSYNARKARVYIEIDAPKNKSITYTGNLLRFRQLIINLISNAIEAYPPAKPNEPTKNRPVIIKLTTTADSVLIQVTDYGSGIRKSVQEKIFDPFYSTKPTGSGIGLFIVKQITEKDFGGTIRLTSNAKTGTTFSISLPK